MRTFRLRNTVLPAFLVSSAVFSALTLPFVLLKSEPLMVELQPLFKGEVQPIFESENKDVVIRYIGSAIVISVGAGLTTIEVLRRQQRARELAQAQPNSSNFQKSLQQPQIQTDELEEMESESDFGIFNWLPEEVNPDIQASITLDAMSRERMFTVAMLGEKTSSDRDYILASQQQYTTCRIKVPYLERRLFAIRVENQYYSFFRTPETKEEALEVATKLNQRGNKVVITQTEQGYAVWLWEPEANLELVS
jgi:hypothetical protein